MVTKCSGYFIFYTKLPFLNALYALPQYSYKYLTTHLTFSGYTEHRNMNQKSFHLRWNNHLQNLQSLFENLYNEQSLVDVTISCTDGQLYGHKLVLSACSPYFEKVFKENPCKHPTIILKGIKSREMQIILQYMYVGAVDVGEDELELLLDTATELQVKGLVQNTGEQQNTKEKNTKSTKESFTSREPSPVHHNGEELKWQAELVATSSSKRKNKESDRQREQVERPTEETSDSDSTVSYLNRFFLSLIGISSVIDLSSIFL